MIYVPHSEDGGGSHHAKGWLSVFDENSTSHKPSTRRDTLSMQHAATEERPEERPAEASVELTILSLPRLENLYKAPFPPLSLTHHHSLTIILIHQNNTTTLHFRSSEQPPPPK